MVRSLAAARPAQVVAMGHTGVERPGHFLARMHPAQVVATVRFLAAARPSSVPRNPAEGIANPQEGSVQDRGCRKGSV